MVVWFVGQLVMYVIIVDRRCVVIVSAVRSARWVRSLSFWIEFRIRNLKFEIE